MKKTRSGFIFFTILTVLFLFTGLGYLNFVQHKQVIAAVNQLSSSFNLARLEAVKRGIQVSICPRHKTADECGNEKDWAQGWIVFVDENNEQRILDSTERLIASPALSKGIRVNANTNGVSYDASGFLVGTPLSMVIKPHYCLGASGRSVSISASGRLSIDQIACRER